MKKRTGIFYLSLFCGIVLFTITEFFFFFYSYGLLYTENGIDINFQEIVKLILDPEFLLKIISHSIAYSLCLAIFGKKIRNHAHVLSGFVSNFCWLIVFCFTGLAIGIISSIIVILVSFAFGAINIGLDMYYAVLIAADPAVVSGPFCAFFISFIWRINIRADDVDLGLKERSSY